MISSRLALLSMLLTVLLGSASHASADGRFTPVSISDLRSDPARWDGRQVIVSGVAVYAFEHSGLYPDARTACARQRQAAIYADWTRVGSASNTIRAGRFRGTFRDDQGVVKPDGTVLVSNAAPGPGPLAEIEVLEWTTDPITCPN